MVWEKFKTNDIQSSFSKVSIAAKVKKRLITKNPQKNILAKHKHQLIKRINK